MKSLCRPLRLAPVTLKAFMRLEAPALSGCGLLFGLSFVGGHRGLRLTVLLARHGKKGTMSPKELACKNLHGPHPFPRLVGPLNRDKDMSEASYIPACRFLRTTLCTSVRPMSSPFGMPFGHWQWWSSNSRFSWFSAVILQLLP